MKERAAEGPQITGRACCPTSGDEAAGRPWGPSSASWWRRLPRHRQECRSLPARPAAARAANEGRCRHRRPHWTARGETLGEVTHEVSGETERLPGEPGGRFLPRRRPVTDRPARRPRQKSRWRRRLQRVPVGQRNPRARRRSKPTRVPDPTARWTDETFPCLVSPRQDHSRTKRRQTGVKPEKSQDGQVDRVADASLPAGRRAFRMTSSVTGRTRYPATPDVRARCSSASR